MCESVTGDESNRTHAHVGIASGLISLGLVVVNLAAEDDPSLRNQFALVMGAAGGSSLALGILNLRRERDDQVLDVARQPIYLLPTFFRGVDTSPTVGVMASVAF
jgi:hypothetical protein